MVVENSAHLAQVEDGDEEEHAQIMRESMMKPAQTFCISLVNNVY